MNSIDDATTDEWDKARSSNPYKREQERRSSGFQAFLAREAAKIKGDGSALDKQVGGDHYKSLAIQPIEYVTKNNMGYCEANIVKYITRHASKGGRQDIEKVIHYAELLLEMKYND